MACKYYINGLTFSKDEFLNYVKKQPIEESAPILGISVTPSAPFITDTNAYVKLGLRIAAQQAVKEGAQTLAWTTSTQQFDRWGSEKISWRQYPTQRSPISGSWIVDVKEQVEGTAFAGVDIGGTAMSVKDKIVSNKEQLRKLINDNLKRERTDSEIDKLTDRIWNRMQTEDSGTSLPRKEGMEEFYGVPSDIERAKSFTVSKDGDLFVVKDENGRPLRSFKKENEAIKFKEDFGLGIVGKVAESLFKQTPKTVEIGAGEKLEIRPSKKGDGFLVYTESGEGMSGIFDTREEAQDFINRNKKGGNVNKFTQHSIDITPDIIAEVTQGMPLFQNKGLGAQGAIVMQAANRVVYAMTNPNVTTPLHEMAHGYFDTLISAAENGNAQAAADVKVFAEQAGVSAADLRTDEAAYTKAQELFARGFERYLRDGVAPSKELQGLFDKFRNWLMDIYKSLSESPINVPLNDAMREVYGRMLTPEIVAKDFPKTIDATYSKESVDLFGELAAIEGASDLRRNSELAKMEAKYGKEKVALAKLIQSNFDNITDQLNKADIIKKECA